MDDGLREVGAHTHTHTHTRARTYVHTHTHTHTPQYRLNKFFKGLLRNANKALTVLANAVTVDMAAAYIQMCRPGSLVRTYDVLKADHHTCFLEQKVC